MKILGISGDPTSKGSTEKLVKLIMECSGEKEQDFIALRNLDIKPCRGCFGCIQDNHCKRDDDWNTIENTVKEAEVLILGVTTYYGAAFGINALTHTFLERWFALRHKGIKLNVKKVILAVVSGGGHQDAAINNLKTFFQVYHGIQDIDVLVAQGTIPCLVCGEGETCPISFAVRMYGEGVKITPDMLPSLEKQEAVLAQAKKFF
ncbi:hypothetical protein SCACP_08470 [Sporomusa carbonis]|uniref:flavodoxin family protein n=1 Tax=Sporomusa carbonis TaxID=3076075 RepID=UPI003A6F20AC